MLFHIENLQMNLRCLHSIETNEYGPIHSVIFSASHGNQLGYSSGHGTNRTSSQEQVQGKVHPKSKLFSDERADENETNTVDRL